MRKTGLILNDTAVIDSEPIVSNKIVKRDGKYYVYSKDGTKKLGGPYDTRKEAEKRLGQIEAFKNNQFSSLKFNLKAKKAQTRYETLEGKQYLVVPCVMLTEGVHEGSAGPLYYPAAELAKIPDVWNSKPVVVYHPELNGQGISACDPDVFKTRKIGMLFNTKWEDGKLKTECWIDEAKANEVDERVMEAIQNGQMMEVSTGLFTDNEYVEGEWNGETYTAIARNYRPDHLAILPDLVGACSIDDGGGLLRNMKISIESDEIDEEQIKRLIDNFLKNELSHSDIRDKLNDKIRGNGNMDKWVIDIYDDFFIYEEGDKQYYQEYSIKDDEVKLLGLRKEAEKITQYQLSDGTMVGNNVKVEKPILSNNLSTNKKEKQMDREKVVDGLIGNEKSPWTEEDREMLMGLSDEKFAVVANQEDEKKDEPKKDEPKDEPKKDEPVADDKTADEDETASEDAPTGNMTVEQYIANAPKEIAEVLNSSLAAQKAQKAELIKKITANKRNPFTAEYLQTKKLEELQGIAQLADVPTPTDNEPAPPIFIGQGEPMANNQDAGGEEPLELPVMSFGKE